MTKMTENDLLKQIVLIEDSPQDVDLTLRAFAKRKLANPVTVARDGEEAMRLIDGWESGAALPVLILLDLKLPKIDGLEVLARLKDHPKLRMIPVVMLTTSAEARDVERAYTLGVNSYIVKPVSFDKFMEVAEKIEVYWGVLNHPWTG